MVLAGLWPYVMRRIINGWTETEFSSFSVAIVGGRVVGLLTVCTLEKLMSYVVFSFMYSQGWECRVVSWVVDMLCCTVGQVAPVGINCQLLPGLGNVLAGSSGRRTVSVVPLRLGELNNALVDVSGRVMGGTDIHTLLNHLQTRLKDSMKDPILLACPNLLQVIMISWVWFLSFFMYMCLFGKRVFLTFYTYCVCSFLVCA